MKTHLLLFSLFVSTSAFSEDIKTLSPTVVTATRYETNSFDLPLSIDAVTGSEVRDARMGANLSEIAPRIPGVVINYRSTAAQELSISTRGFGARSQFGVKGIRIYVDGIPLNSADGQGQAGSINLDTLGQIEFLRGPFSALYGNSSGGVVQQLGYWTQDNYGQDLVIAPTNGEIYYWAINTSVDTAGTPTTDAVKLSSLTGAADCPTIVTGIIVTDENHLMALGCNAIGETTKTPLLFRWADQDNPANWTPSISTSAGGYKLTYGDTIVTAVKTRQETLIFTDSALYGAQYVGTPYTFNIQPRSTNITIASPFAAISVNNITYWMGHKKFFTYNGTVETLPCSLRQFIFNDFNYAQEAQTFACGVGEFNEIWWFYCSADALSPDRYVVYNYQERIWYYGTMDRTAWIDCPQRTYPIAATSGNLVYQENGLADNATGTELPISAFIQSADFDLDDGYHYAFIRRLIPDLTFSGSTDSTPTATMKLYARDFPGGGYVQETDEPIARTATVPVEEFTDQKWLRLRGRQIAFRISSESTGVQWSLGIPRLDISPDGLR